MGAVLYGPVGSGKTRIAARLAKLLNLANVVDGCTGEAAYRRTSLSPKNRTLYVTNEPPPARLEGVPVILSIQQAQRMVNS